MINLPLTLLTAPAQPATTTEVEHAAADHAFGAVLSSLLDDAEAEVVEMVEALESLAEADADARDVLETVGWPLPELFDLVADRTDAELKLSAATPVPAEGELAADPAELIQAVVETATVGAEDEPSAQLMQLATFDVGGSEATGLHDGSTDLTGENVHGLSPADDGDRHDRPPGTTTARLIEDVQPRPDTTSLDPDVDGAEEDAPASPVTPRGLGIRADGSDVRRSGSTRTAGLEPTVEEVSSDRSDLSRSEAMSGSPRIVQSGEMARPASAEPSSVRPPSFSLAMQRVMEAVERLELMAPPRQLTVDLGEHRLRIGLEDGALRLALVDGEPTAGEDFLRDARDELVAQGFDLDEGDHPDPSHQQPAAEEAPRPELAPRRRVMTGLRL